MKEKENVQIQEEKVGLFERYKRYKINKCGKEIERYSDCSGSKIFFDNILMTLLDLVQWAIIAYFVYIWYITRAQPIGCERITADLCNTCFGQMKTLVNGLGNLTINTGGVI